jgi:hypothetical protein
VKPRTRAEHATYMRNRRAAQRAQRPPKPCACGCGLPVNPNPVADQRPRYINGHQPRHPHLGPTEREIYAEQLLWMSAAIVGAVHDEGPQAIGIAIDEALILPAPAGVDPVQALITVLAAQIDPDARTSQSLAWLDQPLPPPRAATPIPEEPAA